MFPCVCDCVCDRVCNTHITYTHTQPRAHTHSYTQVRRDITAQQARDEQSEARTHELALDLDQSLHGLTRALGRHDTTHSKIVFIMNNNDN